MSSHASHNSNVVNYPADAVRRIPKCGKCHSTNVYRDRDIITGERSIACMACGNRSADGSGFYMAEVAAKPKTESTRGGQVARREAHTLESAGSTPAPATSIQRMEEPMKGTCRNCKRHLTIIADGCCFVCRKAAKGLSGAAKEKSLADIKAKIDRGEIRIGGKKKSPQGSQAKATAVIPDGGKDGPTRGVPALAPAMETLKKLIADNEIPVTIRLTIDVSLRVNGVEP